MSFKKIGVALALLGATLFFYPAASLADVPTISSQGQITAPGASIPLSLSGQATCGFTVYGSDLFSATVQGSSDLKVTFQNSTIIPPITSLSTTAVGAVNDVGLSAVRLNFTSVSAPLTYTIVCSGGSGGASSGGGGGGGGSVTVLNFPATQPISAISLPLPTGAAIAALQPALNGDGGSLAHITNFPATQGTYSPNAFVKLSYTFTRPADTFTYAAGDLVANSTVAGSVVVPSFSGAARNAGDAIDIRRVRIITSSTVLTSASFRVHFFETVPVPSVGDNGVFEGSGTNGILATTGSATYVGNVNVGLTNSTSDGAVGVGYPSVGTDLILVPSSGTTIYAVVEALASYIPTSAETFTIIIEGYRS